MATMQFLDVFEEETNKMKENAISLIITWENILKTIILLRLSEYCWIIPEMKSKGLFNNIYFTFGE